jgi:hypothetical protein
VAVLGRGLVDPDPDPGREQVITQARKRLGPKVCRALAGHRGSSPLVHHEGRTVLRRHGRQVEPSARSSSPSEPGRSPGLSQGLQAHRRRGTIPREPHVCASRWLTP